MGATEEWDFVINDVPETTSTDTLVGRNISVTLGDAGYSDKASDAAIVTIGDIVIVVGRHGDSNAIHMQTYGAEHTVLVEGLSSGRTDLGARRNYIRVKRPR